MQRPALIRNLIALLILSVALLAIQQSAVSGAGINVSSSWGNCPAPRPGLDRTDGQGDWAIRPRLGDTEPPTFTEQDARDYVIRRGSWNQAIDASPPSIKRVQFITARAACGELGRRVGRPDAAMVCVVTLRGDFVLAGPPGFGSAGTTEYLIFDATTGNLIAIGLSSS